MTFMNCDSALGYLEVFSWNMYKKAVVEVSSDFLQIKSNVLKKKGDCC